MQILPYFLLTFILLPNLKMTVDPSKRRSFIAHIFITKSTYCFRYCLVEQRTVCIINVWGYTEILPLSESGILLAIIVQCRSRVKIIGGGGAPRAPKSRSFRESGGMLLREIFISWVSEIAFLAVIHSSVRNY